MDSPVKVFKILGEEFLTRFGVLDEFAIPPTTFYLLARKKGFRFMRHPKYGKCVKREWLLNYFETQSNFKR